MGSMIGQKSWIKNFSIYGRKDRNNSKLNKGVFIGALSKIFNELKSSQKGKIFENEEVNIEEN